MWIALTILAVTLLVLTKEGHNAVWGSASFGLIAGWMAAICYRTNDGFPWSVVGKWIVVTTLLGALVEGYCRLVEGKRYLSFFTRPWVIL